MVRSVDHFAELFESEAGAHVGVQNRLTVVIFLKRFSGIIIRGLEVIRIKFDRGKPRVYLHLLESLRLNGWPRSLHCHLAGVAFRIQTFARIYQHPKNRRHNI